MTARVKWIQRLCSYCGKVASRPPSLMQSADIYCDYKCHAADLRGRRPWNKGKTWSAETRKKISEGIRRAGASVRERNPTCKTKGAWLNTTCEVCGKKYHLIPARIARAEHFYCSSACRNGARSRSCVCEHCGKEFTIPFNRFERTGGKYCSRRCNMAIRSVLWAGANNPNWRGGAALYPPEFDEDLRDTIRERDGWVCRLCEQTPQRTLHVHHINYDKKDNSPENLIALCHGCHAKTNGRREYWISVFQRMNSNVKAS